jgi:hypothetical protein
MLELIFKVTQKLRQPLLESTPQLYQLQAADPAALAEHVSDEGLFNNRR